MRLSPPTYTGVSLAAVPDEDFWRLDVVEKLARHIDALTSAKKGGSRGFVLNYCTLCTRLFLWIIFF